MTDHLIFDNKNDDNDFIDIGENYINENETSKEISNQKKYQK